MRKVALIALSILIATPAFAAGGGAEDALASVVILLALILIVAKLFGHVAEVFKQPPVLGELIAGVVLGNLSLVDFHGLEFVKTEPAIELLAGMGVILLLFEVGLETTVKQMMQVGLSSLLVATLGVVGPFALGWGVGAWLLPDHSAYAHAFLGATLTATSVGITARVLRDIRCSQTKEARIILGAAVIDDIQGLMILAVVTGAIASAATHGGVSFGTVGIVLGKAILFLVGGLLVGMYASPFLFRLASRLQTGGVLLALGLAFCFLFAWLAHYIGLAAIVGAFAAGLVLEDLHYKPFTSRNEMGMEVLVAPIVSFLAPIFFVLMGMRTDLRAFAEPGVPALAAVLTVAAIIGKQLSSFGVIGEGVNRLAVGIGMIPRGEVGLIFANIGLTLKIGDERIIDQTVFSAVVVMVIVTTMIAPPALKWSLQRYGSSSQEPAKVAHGKKDSH